MLAQVLPGLRELRTPLAAGYCWLLFFWAAVGGSLPSRKEAAEEGGALARLFQAGDVLQALGIALVLSVFAVLVGSLVMAGTHAATRRFAPPSKAPFDVRDLLLRICVDELNRRENLRKSLAIHDLPEDEYLETSQTIGWQVLLGEAPLLKTKLLAMNEALHSEVDRPDAEAGLRLAVAAPLAVFFTYMTIAASAWWSTGLALSVGLLAHGAHLRRTGQAKLAAAIHSVPEMRMDFAATVADRMFGDRLADREHHRPEDEPSTAGPHQDAAL